MFDPPERAPEPIRDLAEACARFVERALGLPLDGSQETLPILDHYLGQVATDAGDAAVALAATAAGAYFGEVLRAALGDGVWVGVEGDPVHARLVLAGGRLRVAPMEAALEAALGRVPDDAPPVLEPSPAARAAVEAAFEAFGAIAADDFFRLSVRFDALVQAHARVLATSKPGNGAG